MKHISDIAIFLSTDSGKIQKLRIILGYYLFSRFSSLKILGMTLTFSPGLSSYYLLIFKEIFINEVYAFTNKIDSELKMSKKSWTIIDIGANIGLSVAYFHNRYPNAEIIAIEASPINYKLLAENVSVNNLQNVEIRNCFVSNININTKFYHNMTKPGGSFGEGYKEKDGKILKKFDVKTEKISDIVQPYENILIKIDVEGAEYDILEDLALSTNIQEVLEILVEVSIQNLNDFNNLNKALNNFYKLGFEPRIISDFTTKLLKYKSKQGHLQLSLVRNT